MSIGSDWKRSYAKDFTDFCKAVAGDGDAAVDGLAAASCHGVARQSGD